MSECDSKSSIHILQSAVLWLGLLFFAVVSGFGAKYLSLPGNWLIGAMFAAIITGLLGKSSHRVPLPCFRVAQSIIGILLASTFKPDVLSIVLPNIIPIFLVVATTLGVCFISGIVLGRISPLSIETAMLGTLPGGASSMIGMSRDLNADTRIVALMQYTRMILVVLSASLFSRFVFSDVQAAHAPVAVAVISNDMIKPYLITALVAAVGSLIGYIVKFPAGTLIGPMVLGVLLIEFKIFTPVLPPIVVPAAYIAMGIYVGLLYDRAVLKLAGRMLPLIFANIIFLIFFCAGMGWLLSFITGESFLTGYLATTPGGFDSVAIVALGSGANMPIVLAVQMVRLFGVVFTGPLTAQFVVKRKSSSKKNL